MSKKKLKDYILLAQRGKTIKIKKDGKDVAVIISHKQYIELKGQSLVTVKSWE